MNDDEMNDVDELEDVDDELEQDAGDMKEEKKEKKPKAKSSNAWNLLLLLLIVLSSGLLFLKLTYDISDVRTEIESAKMEMDSERMMMEGKLQDLESGMMEMEEAAKMEKEAMMTEKLTYTNQTYGFSLQFPEAWNDRVVTEKLDQEPGYIAIGFPSYFEILQIQIFSEEAFNNLDGPTGEVLGKRNGLVFTGSAPAAGGTRDEFFTARINEIPDILKSFSF